MFLVRLTDKLSRTLMILGAGWAFVLCFLILIDIIMRAINMPISGTKEIVANSVVMIVFLQIGFAIRSGAMLRADFIVTALPKSFQKILLFIALVLGAVLFFFLMKAGIKLAIRSFVNGEFDGEGALRVPVWPTRWMVVLGAGLAGINYLILSIVELFDLRIDPVEL